MTHDLSSFRFEYNYLVELCLEEKKKISLFVHLVDHNRLSLSLHELIGAIDDFVASADA